MMTMVADIGGPTGCRTAAILDNVSAHFERRNELLCPPFSLSLAPLWQAFDKNKPMYVLGLNAVEC